MAAITNTELQIHLESMDESDLRVLSDKVLEIVHRKHSEKFVDVDVYPHGYMAFTIRYQTGFGCKWDKFTGTHTIFVPKEQYTEGLAQSLKAKYDGCTRGSI